MDPALAERPVEILQHLIRFDTTNPPGNEAACIQWVADLLNSAGIETTLLARDPNRPNLIARLKGRGSAPPLLLQGHVDVVTTEHQTWRHPPFEAQIAEGYVWGRGALDMKGGVAMLVAAFMQAHINQIDLPGDVILCLLSDEEAGGDEGALFLVDQHPELFTGVKYAIGEFGGFSMHLRGQKFYPIMVAEKQICAIQVTVRGPGGHGSLPIKGGAMAQLGRVLNKLDSNDLPIHITPVAKVMISTIARQIGFPAGLVLSQLANPALSATALNLLGPAGRAFYPLLRHTVSPTILRGSSKINVIPGEVTLHLDGRILPGYTPADMLGELQAVLGPTAELAVIRHDPGPSAPNMGLFDMLADILKTTDPDGTPLPLMLSGVTDARFFSRLGIQTYGFLPMDLPADFQFSNTIHAADERIPVGAMAFGTRAILTALQRFGE